MASKLGVDLLVICVVSLEFLVCLGRLKHVLICRAEVHSDLHSIHLSEHMKTCARESMHTSTFFNLQGMLVELMSLFKLKNGRDPTEHEVSVNSCSCPRKLNIVLFWCGTLLCIICLSMPILSQKQGRAPVLDCCDVFSVEP